MNRRTFLSATAAAICTKSLLNSEMAIAAPAQSTPVPDSKPFGLSLAQWSLNKRFFGRGGAEKLDNLEFAAIAKSLGFDAIEYVNQMFFDKATNHDYLRQMKQRADDAGVKNLLIMCDREGRLGDPDEKQRTRAVENHYKWVEAAKLLGCHSIRVNASSKGSYEEQQKLAADGLARLSDFARDFGLNVIVENHGGHSSNARWLTRTILMAGRMNCGTLPDFGNFPSDADIYTSVKMMMPLARAVSAKSRAFDDQGNETRIDYHKMMAIVLDSGYRGYVGVEFEGAGMPEEEGIKATRDLLLKIRNDYPGQKRR